MMQTIFERQVLEAFARRIERAAPNAAGWFWLLYAVAGIVVLAMVL